MKQVVTFKFGEHDIRVVFDRTSQWFVGRDVCLAHGLKNPNAMMKDRWKTAVPVLKAIKDRMGRDQDVRVLTLDETLDLVRRVTVPLPGFEPWLINEVAPQLVARKANPKSRK